jgi:hypothetical protein
LLAGRPTPPTGLAAEPFVVCDVAFFGDLAGAFLVRVPAALARGLDCRGPGAAAVDPAAIAKAGAVPIASAAELTASDGTEGDCMPLAS